MIERMPHDGYDDASGMLYAQGNALGRKRRNFNSKSHKSKTPTRRQRRRAERRNDRLDGEGGALCHN